MMSLDEKIAEQVDLINYTDHLSIQDIMARNVLQLKHRIMHTLIVSNINITHNA